QEKKYIGQSLIILKIKMKRRIVTFCLLCFTISVSVGQTLLTAQEAVEIALENNYAIKLSANDLMVAKENVTYGNAGILPSVTAKLSQNNSVQNSTHVQNNGVERSLDNAKNNNMSYGVSLGWTVFDGLGMFARYEKLQEFQKQGDVACK